jgi:hypothetical protein
MELDPLDEYSYLGWIEEFKEFLKSIEGKSFTFKTKAECYPKPTTSKTYDSSKKKSVNVWEVPIPEEPNKHCIIAKRAIVKVAPCSVRDTLITDLPSLWSTRYCEENLGFIIELMKESVYETKPDP